MTIWFVLRVQHLTQLLLQLSYLFLEMIKLQSKLTECSPNKNAVKVAFCTTIGDVPPVLVFLQFPQPGEPVQDTDLKLPGMDPVVAFDERIAQVVNGEVLQLRQSSIIEVKIVRIPCKSEEQHQSYGLDRTGPNKYECDIAQQGKSKLNQANTEQNVIQNGIAGRSQY